MIFLYYTGAKKFNSPQIDPSLSLGGYVSATKVQNDKKNSIFEDVSTFQISNKLSDCVCLALKNETNAAIVNISFFLKPDDDDIFDYEIAFVSVSTDSCNDKYFENLQSIHSTPYYATFQQATELSPVVISSIASGDYLGLFVKRTLKQAFITDFCNKDQSVPISKQIELNLSW